MHHKHREYLPTICAGHTLFECGHPCPRLQHPCTLADSPRRLSALLVVAAVVSPTTFATVGELSSAGVVKFAQCFPQTAHHAPPERHLAGDNWVVLTSLIHRKLPNSPSQRARMSGSRGSSYTRVRTWLFRRGSRHASGP